MASLYQYLLGFSLLIYFGLVAAVWRDRRYPLHNAFFWATVSACLWMLCTGLELFSGDLSVKIWAHRLRYFFVALTGPLWYLCILRFAVPRNKPTPDLASWIVVSSGITAFISMASGYHNLFHYDFKMQNWNELLILQYATGPWFAIHMLVTILVLLLTLQRLIILAKNSRNVFFFRRTMLMIFVTILPTIMTIAFNLGFNLIPGYSLVPFTFSIIGIAQWLALFHYRFLELAPIAREAVFHSLAEAMLVFDYNFRLVDFNSAADKIRVFTVPLRQGILMNEMLSNEEFARWFSSDSVSDIFHFNHGPDRCVLEMSVHPIIDDCGDLIGKVLLARDVTIDFLARKSLSESEERYRQLMEACPFPLLIINHEDHLIAYANSQTAEWSGLPLTELVGNSPDQFYADSGLRAKALQQLVATGKIDAMEVEFVLGNDSRYLTLMSGRRLIYAGKKSALIALLDITEMRSVEAANAVLVSRNRELMVTEEERQRIGRELHDSLGQKLTGVAFLAGALQERFYSERGAEFPELESIKQSINAAIAEVRSLSHGLNPLDLHGTGLWHALKEMLEAAAASPAALSCELLPPTPLFIANSEASLQLFRIAQEAVQNAIRHSQTIKILVKLEVDQGRGELQIIDQGCGFVAEKSAASGRGLSIMKFRAGLIGAELKIESQPDCGTLVRVIFNV